MGKFLLSNLKTFAITVLMVFTLTNSFGQCPSDYAKEYTWQTHTNWFFGQAQVMNFGAGGTTAPNVTTKVGAGSPYTAYEGTASASDENGNLVIYTNGVNLYDGTGTQVTVPGGRLLTGAENAGGNAGSAVQGVMIVKHPLNNDEYYIFTTDDAISGAQNNITNGFNYFVYTKSTNSCSGATRLGNYRSTEQVAATWHNNGVDVWIVSHESGTGTTRYNAYLLSCTGLNTTPVTSDVGFNVDQKGNANEFSNERASLQFQWTDGSTQIIKAGATHHCGTGTWDPTNSVSILDFDCLNGTFTFDRGLGDGSVRASNPYDCEFSPDNSRLYVTFQGDQWSGPLLGEIGYYPVGGGAFVSLANAGNGGTMDIGGIKLGGDGTLYSGGFNRSPWGYLGGLTTITNPDGANAGNATIGGQNAGANSVGYGVPNMFVPPVDDVEIQDPGALTDCDFPIDLETNWKCKGTDAENTPLYENAYTVVTTGANGCAGCTINPITGVFNDPGFTTARSYEVVFTICTIEDTLLFNVGTCNCDVQLKNSTPTICVGETVLLDSLVTSTTGASTWTIDSVPTTATIDAVLTEGLTDTVFDATNVTTKPGTYKLMLTSNSDANCKDSIYIVVNPIPVVDINPVADLCEDSTTVTITSDSTNGTLNWFIEDVAVTIPVSFNPQNYTYDFSTNSVDSSEVKLVYTSVDGCENRDSIFVKVHERKDASFTLIDSVCAGETPSLVKTNAGGTWSSECDGSSCLNTVTETFISANSGVGTFEVYYTFPGMCGHSDTDTIKVNPVRDATIVNDDTTMCWNAPVWNVMANFTGGIWNVNGIDVPGNLQNTPFDPSSIPAGLGGGPISPITITYRFEGMCGDTDTIVINVVDTAFADISTTKHQFCLNDGTHQITNNGDGSGTWSGPGVNASGLFDPATAGATTPGNPHIIKYVLNTACPDSDTVQIFVNPMKDATITDSPTNDTISACILEGTKVFNVATTGGTFNVFDNTNTNIGNTALNVAGTVVTVDVTAATGLGEGIFYIEHLQANPCGDTDTVWINIVSQLDATINPIADSLCITANSFSVGLQQPGTGTVFINGVATAEPVTFDPATEGPGSYEIVHHIGGGCGDSDTTTIVIIAEPLANMDMDTVFCEQSGFHMIDLSNATAGGTLTSSPTTPALDTFGPLWNANEPNTVGKYTVTYSVSNSHCSADSTLPVRVKALPSFTFTYPLDTVCDSANTIQLGMTLTPSTATGVWSNNANVNSTGLFTIPKGVTSGYVMKFDATNEGCTRDTNISIVIKKMFDPTFVLQNQICVTGGLLQLGPDAVEQGGVWSGTGIIDAVNGTFDPTAANIGDNQITYTDAGMCGATSTMPIEVLTAKVPTIQPVTSVCAGSGPIQLIGGPDANGTWGGDVSATGTFTPSDSGTFIATYSYPNDLCPSDTDTISFYIKYVPQTDFTATPRDTCIPFSPTFTDQSDSVALTSLWTFGNGQTSATLASVNTTYTQEGCHTVTLQNTYANGCASEITKPDYVCGRGIPVADFMWAPVDPDIFNSEITFTNTSQGGTTFEWDFDSTNANPNPVTSMEPISQLVVYSAEDADTPRVQLIAINEYGCADTIIKPVPIKDIMTVYIANAFTPNGDGRNDDFFPLGRNLEFGQDYEFLVFNRWGSLIWKSNIPYEAWDGRVTMLAPTSGKIAQIDVYVWKLKVVDPYSGDKHDMVGHVSLIR